MSVTTGVACLYKDEKDRFCTLIQGHPGDHVTEPPEKVNHPPHYGGDTTYEVIKVLEAWGLTEDAYLFNTVKYIARAGKKSQDSMVEDLEKAAWYLIRKVKRLRGEL